MAFSWSPWTRNKITQAAQESQSVGETSTIRLRCEDSTWRKEAAERARRFEKDLGLLPSLRVFMPAALFSTILSLSCIMEGYDMVLINQFYALHKFKQDFGKCTTGPEGKCEVTAGWETTLTLLPFAGEIIGLLASGILVDRFGYKRTIIGNLAIIIAFIFPMFFAPNLHILALGLFLCGMPWGCFQTLAPGYASEVCPVKIRGYFTTWTSLCWIIGQLVGSGVLRSLITNGTSLAYRLPLGLQWIWPPLIILGCLCVAESPWYLIRHDRLEEARSTLTRLTSRKHSEATAYDIDDNLAMLFETNKMEKEDKLNGNGEVGYKDCFKGANLRRTEIACVAWAVGNACGTPLMSFSTYFFKQAGLNDEMAFDLSLAQVRFLPHTASHELLSRQSGVHFASC